MTKFKEAEQKLKPESELVSDIELELKSELECDTEYLSKQAKNKPLFMICYK